MSDTSLPPESRVFIGAEAPPSARPPFLPKPPEPESIGQAVNQASQALSVERQTQAQDEAGMEGIRGRVQQKPIYGLAAEYRAQGFSDEEIGKEFKRLRTEWLAAGRSPDEIDELLSGNIADPRTVPDSYVQRFLKGNKIGRVLDRIGQGIEIGSYPDDPLGPDPGGDFQKFMEEAGIYNKPGETSWLRFFNQGMIDGSLRGLDAAARIFTMAAGGSAGGARQIQAEVDKELYGKPTSEGVVKGDIEEGIEAANIAALLMGNLTPSARLRRGKIEPVGVMPRGEDFGNSARFIGTESAPIDAQYKLSRLWEEKGVHPAEVAADASDDVVITQRILSADPEDMPYTREPEFEELREVPSRELVAGGGGRKPPSDEPPEIEILPPEPSGNLPAVPNAGEIIDLDRVYGDAEVAQARKDIREKLSIGGKEKKSLTFTDIIANTFDSLVALEKKEKQLSGGRLREPIDSPYIKFRLMAGEGDKARAALRYGPVDANTAQKVGRGFEQILDDVRKVGNINEFRDFITAARAMELEARGIESGFPRGSIAPIIQADRPKYEKLFGELVQFQNNVMKYVYDKGAISKKSYDRLVKGNSLYVPFHRLIDDELLHYDPLKPIKGSNLRTVDPLETIVRNVHSLYQFADRNEAKRALVDMLKEVDEALPIGQTAKRGQGERDATRLLLENNAATDFDDELLDELMDLELRDRGENFSILRDGVKEYYKIDPALAEAVRYSNNDDINWLFRIFAPPASVFRAGSVLNPIFLARFLMRDFPYAQMTFRSQGGKKLGIFTPRMTFKGIFAQLVKNPRAIEFMESGAGGGAFARMDRDFLQEDLNNMLRLGLAQRAWNVMVNPNNSFGKKFMAGLGFFSGGAAVNKYIMHPLRLALETTLSANRMGAFDKAMKGKEINPKNLAEAAWVSRQTGIDPAVSGRAMRGLNLIAAFTTATIADPYRLVKAFRDHPAQATLIVSGLMAGTAAHWSWTHDDPMIKDLPQWRKDLFWNFPIHRWVDAMPGEDQGVEERFLRYSEDGRLQIDKGFVFPYPKPFGLGMLFATGTERMLDSWFGENPDAFEGFFKSMWESSVPEFIPTAAVPFLQQGFNKDGFNKTLIPEYLLKGLPEYQYTTYTSELSKWLGKTFSAFPGISNLRNSEGALGAGVTRALTSPILIENYVQQWTGGLGKRIMEGADYILRKTGKLPDPSVFRPERDIYDNPYVRAFALRAWPDSVMGKVETFYKRVNSLGDRYLNSWRAQVDLGNLDEANKILYSYVRDKGLTDLDYEQWVSSGRQGQASTMFVQLDGLKTTIGDQFKLIRFITDDPNTPKMEKGQLIDSMFGTILQLSEQGTLVIDQLEAGAQ